MTLINAGNTSWPAILNEGIRRLLALRTALEAVDDYNRWLSAQAAADLEAQPIGAPPADLVALQSAFADADVFVQLYDAGSIPSSYGYTDPASPYVFGASQRLVIGPQ